MKWIKILECPYCGYEVEEGAGCCSEVHAQWIEVCAQCFGVGTSYQTYNSQDGYIEAICLKCKGTGGRAA